MSGKTYHIYREYDRKEVSHTEATSDDLRFQLSMGISEFLRPEFHLDAERIAGDILQKFLNGATSVTTTLKLPDDHTAEIIVDLQSPQASYLLYRARGVKAS